MSPRPHDGTAEEGLSSSLLQIVHDPRRVEHLRDVLSSFCHRCRNSLNGIKLSLYLFRRESRGTVPHCWSEIEGIYQQVEQLFDRMQAIYRPMAIRMVDSPLEELIRAHAPRWRAWYESRGLSLQLEPPDGEVDGEFDPILLGQGLDAMASWRAEAGAAGTLSRIAWCLQGETIEILWREEPHPEPPDLLEHPGGPIRREPGTCSRRLDPLALPLLSRIVSGHGGTFECERGAGFVVRIRWPRCRAAVADGVA